MNAWLLFIYMVVVLTKRSWGKDFTGCTSRNPLRIPTTNPNAHDRTLLVSNELQAHRQWL